MSTKKPKRSQRCPVCNKGKATKELHSCPYQLDVNNVPEKLCNCCKDCEQDCQDSI